MTSSQLSHFRKSQSVRSYIQKKNNTPATSGDQKWRQSMQTLRALLSLELQKQISPFARNNSATGSTVKRGTLFISTSSWFI